MNAHYVAFSKDHKLIEGALSDVALAVLHAQAESDSPTFVVFDLRSGEVVDLDLRGTEEDIVRAHREPDSSPSPPDRPADAPAPPRGRGRPKLGVVGREVTLLPRQWDWLKSQRGGASATLRRLVDVARKASEIEDEQREAQGRTYGFMTVMLGDRPGFEEATRALYAGNRTRFFQHAEAWPKDLREHVQQLAEAVFQGPAD